MTLCGILIAMLVCCHWLACIMGIAGGSFVTSYLDGTPEMDYSFSRYLAALYWATTTVTTVGYGDVLPKTDDERIVAMLAMCVGGGFYGFVVGTLTSIITVKDHNQRMRQERMEMVRGLHTMRFRDTSAVAYATSSRNCLTRRLHPMRVP